MGTTPEMKKPFIATMKEDWKGMTNFYKENNDNVLFPITISKDTALHMAVYSNKKQPLKDVLDIVKDSPMLIEGDWNPLQLGNAYGNTALHVAVMNGNIEAVKVLVSESEKLKEPEPEKLLLIKNNYGETPLFKAASFGYTEIVKYLIQKPGQIDNNNELLDVHRQRKDSQSILHAAIQGEHFETALLLLKKDESLAELKNEKNWTCLHLLAMMPAAFKSGYSMSILSRFLYSCLPVGDDSDIDIPESGWRRDVKGLSCNINLLKGWPMLETLRENKRKHKMALRLAELLIKKDDSWIQVVMVQEGRGIVIEERQYQPFEIREKKEENAKKEEKSEIGEKKEENDSHPLFIASSTGIIEIVRAILKEFPQAVELLNKKGQNILHIAVMHRKREMFHLLKQSKILLSRLCIQIDNEGYTLLHEVADIKSSIGRTQPGPALKLQEELDWFARVRKVIPSYHAKHRDKNGMTAEELFKEKHEAQLKAAQKWTKETSQSCSAVAVLVATIVFAAAYTIPGGSNEQGFPIFLHSKFFMFFTIMDVIALASSLTSVVMFLSILTSPFEYEDFHHSIPRKLMMGFSFLFFSVMTTMLAFAATLLLIIRSKNHWTTGLISIAAFFPVSVFALMQLRLYVASIGSMKGIFKAIRKVVPCFGVLCLFCRRKQHQRLFGGLDIFTEP